MAGLDDIRDIIPIDQVAAKLGVDEDTARSAVDTALPALVGGLHANAQDPAGAASLSKALATKDPSVVRGGVSLDDVDDTDGAKIVANIFGDNEDRVIATLGSTTKAGGSGLLQKLLPILAPIVMAFLADKVAGRSGSTSGTASRSGEAESGGGVLGGLGDVLGGILGGGSSASSGSGGGAAGGLGDVLGGLLGGGSGGGIADILGGLLGGGKR